MRVKLISFLFLCATAFSIVVTADLREEDDLKVGVSDLQVTGGSEGKPAIGLNNNKAYVKKMQKTLRCWQHGELIVAEKNIMTTLSQVDFFTSSNQPIFLRQYGETFCMYTGEKK